MSLEESSMLDEINSEHLNPMLKDVRKRMLDDFRNTRPFSFADVQDPALRRDILYWLNNTVRNDLATTKHAAVSFIPV